MIQNIKALDLTDRIIAEFEMQYLGGLLFYFRNDCKILYGCQGFLEKGIADESYGEFYGDIVGFSYDGQFIIDDNMYIEDPNLYKITDSTGQHILWERSPEDPIDDKWNSKPMLERLIRYGYIKRNNPTKSDKFWEWIRKLNPLSR
jgi:hypothetical protein